MKAFFGFVTLFSTVSVFAADFESLKAALRLTSAETWSCTLISKFEITFTQLNVKTTDEQTFNGPQFWLEFKTPPQSPVGFKYIAKIPLNETLTEVNVENRANRLHYRINAVFPGWGPAIPVEADLHLYQGKAIRFYYDSTDVDGRIKFSCYTL